MKILGIYPQLINTKNIILRSTSGEPIGLGIMLSIAKELGHEIEYIPFIKNSTHELIKFATKFKPDICLYSIMTSQYNLAFDIASHIKKIHPQVVNIAGGYHPTSGAIIEYPFDFHIKGEGEHTFKELITSLSNGNSYSDIKGISYISNDEVVNNHSSERIVSLNDYSIPFRNTDSTSQKYYGLIYPQSNHQTGFAYIEYGRGCFNNCVFCSKPSMFSDNKVIFRKPFEVVNEIINLIKDFNINLLFFTDLNFTANNKKVEELCHEIIKSEVKISWFCMSNLSTAKSSTLALMKKAGCIKIMYGVETVSGNLTQMTSKNKGNSLQSLQDTINAGILVQIFYVVGFPWETIEKLESSISAITHLPAHQIRITIATPLHGSKWYDDYNKQELSSNLDLFDTGHLVFKNSSFSQNQLNKTITKIYRQFYLSENYITKMHQIISIDSGYLESFECFFTELNKQEIINTEEKKLLMNKTPAQRSSTFAIHTGQHTSQKMQKNLSCQRMEEETTKR